MLPKECSSCRAQFWARPQSPHQAYCSNPDCQRERRRRWNKDKLQADPDYRANQRSAQQAWHAKNPDYWKSYRRRRQTGSPEGQGVTQEFAGDASSCGADSSARRYWMDLTTEGPDGTQLRWRLEVRLLGSHKK